ncbi:phage tail assembly chaperone [Salipiger marinus]|uniref:phage tail assembly chaperone n=1 Tax=Salipiger marinus TaxID=555512 RepID=UPI003CC535FF
MTEALLWSLRYSPDEVEYLEHKQAPELANRVQPESWFFWQAYHHLRGSRPMGFGVGPIPFDAIARYSEWLGQTCPVDRARLVKVIMALDNAEREYLGRKTG